MPKQWICGHRHPIPSWGPEVEEKQESESTYIIGEEVKILDGPFNSFTGHIESIENQKVKISVLIFGRKTIVELAISQIDKLID